MSSFKLEKLVGTNTGIGFYPIENGPNESRESQFKAEDETLDEGINRRLLHLHGAGHKCKLDPAAIFRSVTDAVQSKLAPEQTITLFALRLAIIEKLASGIGTLSFIWASTIILGGFASNLNTVDFIVVAIILTTEGTRIFSRSRELEWKHMASKTNRSDNIFQILQEASPNFHQHPHGDYCRNPERQFEHTIEKKSGKKKLSRLSEDDRSSGGGERPAVSFTQPRRLLEWKPSFMSARGKKGMGSIIPEENVDNFSGVDIDGVLKEIITRTNTMQPLMQPIPEMTPSSEAWGDDFGPLYDSMGRGMPKPIELGVLSPIADGESSGSDSTQLRLKRHSSEPEKVLLRSLGSINMKNVDLNSMEPNKASKFQRTQSCVQGKTLDQKAFGKPERINSYAPERVKSLRKEEVNPCGHEKITPTMLANNARTWSSEVVPVLPGGMSKFLSNRGVGSVLGWIQLSSAVICLALSGWRISQQDFDPPGVGKDDRPVNMYMCVNLFYILALMEAFMFLMEQGYWEYKVSYEQLILKVSDNAGLGIMGHEIMKQFFYEVYKKCVEGSVFDGLEMDLVDFSLSLLQSDNTFEQLGALRVLRNIVDRYDGFSADALRRIGTTPGIIERLVEMLSWRSAHHGDILQEVAALVCRAVRFSKNCLRIAAVPGSMDMVVSLVKTSDRDRAATSTVDKSMMDTLPSTVHNVAGLRLDGLRILVAQARDPANLLKIGQARGLVPALVALIAIKDPVEFKSLRGEKLKTFKKVMRLLAMLVGARNVSGTVIRPIIARVVSCIASMRDILQFGDCHPQLQWMAIEILTNLALDNEIRVAIGGTGGVIRNLLMLYIRGWGGSGTFADADVVGKVRQAVSKRAGEALNFLAIQNKKNCMRMMELEMNGKRAFIPALLKLLAEQKEQTILAAKILRSLMEYADEAQQREIAVCAPRLMRILICTSNMKLLEAVTGLAPRVVGFLKDDEYNHVVETVDREPLIQKLLTNLDHDPQMFTAFPRTRRYTIECILALVKRDPIFLDEFTRQGLLQKKLVKTLDSVCEVENFLTFSGAEGLTRYSVSVEDLVQQTLLELRDLTAKRASRHSLSDALSDQFIIVHE